jgi:hypothetical protein
VTNTKKRNRKKNSSPVGDENDPEKRREQDIEENALGGAPTNIKKRRKKNSPPVGDENDPEKQRVQDIEENERLMRLYLNRPPSASGQTFDEFRSRMKSRLSKGPKNKGKSSDSKVGGSAKGQRRSKADGGRLAEYAE